MKLFAVTADLVERPAAQKMREADERRHAAAVGHRSRLHRCRPRPAVGFCLRAADRRHFRVLVHEGDASVNPLGLDQIRIVVHQQDVSFTASRMIVLRATM